jgi:hypothetical protein
MTPQTHPQPPTDTLSQDTSPPLNDPLGLDIVLTSPGTATQLAANDAFTAFATIRGTPSLADTQQITPSLNAADAPAVISIQILPNTDTGAQGYRIQTADFGGGRAGLQVTAANDTAAMYALYDIIGRMGVLYIHPEQTFFPQNPQLHLPDSYTGTLQQPAFTTRGLHEHTQHPTEMSDLLLRPGDPSFRTYASHYLKWLARNRQNLLSFHLLKTVDLDAWLPYIADIRAEANRYGISLGAALSLSDQQQNNFKLIRDDVLDPLTGQVPPADTQIRQGIDRLFSADLDFLVLQIGTSEFTKPSDSDVLGWLNVAVTHAAQHHPSKQLHAWIHIFCDLQADDGGYFYHLPAQADPRLGAWVHTTMFYTLDHPAPVYSCQNFSHQLDFLSSQSGRRTQTFFPESAWWLGFDNNLPLLLPITGWSRAYDVSKLLSAFPVSGHVTFTTGKEWTYWQYDHHAMALGWEGTLSWDDYLSRISPLYGDAAPLAAAALSSWTTLQVKHFYQENPDIFFYLAGELPQDELGERAGILARRPKPSFQSIFSLDDTAFSQWQQRDLSMLSSMEAEYQAILNTLPPTPADASAPLYAELRATMDLFVLRISHTRTLYEGVAAARAGDLPAAQSKLAAATALSAQAEAITRAGAQRYRYPLELLIEPKPSSLTSYPYGYLKETHEAYFWHRRDDQLQRLILRAFDASPDAWTRTPSLLFFTDSTQTQMKVPSDRVAATIISSFVPQMLFGLSDIDLPASTMTLQVSEDYNKNFLPDVNAEVAVPLSVSSPNTWTGALPTYALSIHDTTDNLVGALPIYAPTFTLSTLDDGRSITSLNAGDLIGEIDPQELISIIRSVAGIDVNGAENLIKQVYKLPPDQPLPARLPIHFLFTFTPAQ